MRKKYFPIIDNTVVCSYKEQDDQSFEVVLRLPFTLTEEVYDWLNQFQAKSLTTLRVSKTYCYSGIKVNFKREYRCQHKAKVKPLYKVDHKYTDCPFYLTAIIKEVGIKSKTKDFHLFTHPTCITVRFCHNHPLASAEILKHRDVSKEVQEKLINLFKAGHLAETALDLHKFDLKIGRSQEEMTALCNDRNQVPDINWCKGAFYKLSKEDPNFTTVRKFNDNYNVLDLVNSYNRLFSGNYLSIAKVEAFTSVALCHPLMDRIHRTMNTEHIFINVLDSKHKNSHCVVYAMIHSFIGPLPLGAVVVSLKNEPSLHTALCQLRDLWMQIDLTLSKLNIINLNRLSITRTIIVENRYGLKNAVQAAFPNCQIMSNQYCELLEVWKWLLDSNNNINPLDAHNMLQIVREMMFASEIPIYWSLVEKLNSSDYAVNYYNFMSFMQGLDEHRNDWASCFITSMDNYECLITTTLPEIMEDSMKIYKDLFLSNIQSLGLYQTVDFLCSRFVNYYEHRLNIASKNKIEELGLKYGFPIANPMEVLWVSKKSTDNYNIYCETKEKPIFLVNSFLWTCTCPIGLCGGGCRHQSAVIERYNIETFTYSNMLNYEEVSLICKCLGRDCPNSLDMSKSLNIASISQSLSLIFQQIKLDLENNPQLFESAISSFINNYNFLSNEADKAQALESFGRQPQYVYATFQGNMLGNNLIQATNQSNNNSIQIINMANNLDQIYATDVSANETVLSSTSFDDIKICPNLKIEGNTAHLPKILPKNNNKLLLLPNSSNVFFQSNNDFIINNNSNINKSVNINNNDIKIEGETIKNISDDISDDSNIDIESPFRANKSGKMKPPISNYIPRSLEGSVYIISSDCGPQNKIFKTFRKPTINNFQVKSLSNIMDADNSIT